MITVEDGVPVPGRITAEAREKLASIEPGQSIVVPAKTRNSLNTAFRELRPKKFMARKIDRDTARIWRVS